MLESKKMISRKTKKKVTKAKSKTLVIDNEMRGFFFIIFSILVSTSILSSYLSSPIDNILGKYLGTMLSTTVFNISGKITALVLPMFLFIIGYNKISRSSMDASFRRLLFFVLLFIESTIVLSIKNLENFHFLNEIPVSVLHNSGGIIGNFLVQRGLGEFFGDTTIGMYLITASIMVLTLAWGLRIDLHNLYQKIAYVIKLIGSFINFTYQEVLGFITPLVTAITNSLVTRRENKENRDVESEKSSKEQDKENIKAAKLLEKENIKIAKELEKENKLKEKEELKAQKELEKLQKKEALIAEKELKNKVVEIETKKETINVEEIENDFDLSEEELNKTLQNRLEARQKSFIEDENNSNINLYNDSENNLLDANLENAGKSFVIEPEGVLEEDDISLDTFVMANIETKQQTGSNNNDISNILENTKPEEIVEKEIYDEAVINDVNMDTTIFEKNTDADFEVAENIEDENTKTYDEYVMPKLEVLGDAPTESIKVSAEEIQQNSNKLIENLKDYMIDARIIEVSPGPVVTRYELRLAPGTKISKIEGISKDLAVAMGVSKIRISVVPERSSIGIELPNVDRQTVFIKNVLDSPSFTQYGEDDIPIVLGKDIAGKPMIANLVQMPHLLIAGTTGSGKSVCTNSFLASILLSKTPEELRLILIDPKVVEMTPYNGIPHLLSDVITVPKEALNALKWATAEMERRYQLLAKVACRNIAQFNKKIREDKIPEGKLSSEDTKKMPFIVIVIDELADLMMSVGKDLEMEIVRIAQKARAIGIHLIVATQRPEAKVVTGLIKSNLPSRVALTVGSGMDSRMILDEKGAELLLGRGDMLFKSVNDTECRRIHGTFIDNHETEELVEFCRNQNVKKDKVDSFEVVEKSEIFSSSSSAGGAKGGDELRRAASIVVERQQGSISMLQRRMSVGFAKAGRLMDQLEEIGIVGPSVGSKAREVLLGDEGEIDITLYEYEKAGAA